MLLTHQIHVLDAACEDFAIAKPDYLLAAEKLKVATAALLAKVQKEVPPSTTGLTVKTLESTFGALLAWPSHVAREAVAAQLAQVGETAVMDGWTAFSPVLMEQLRVPFDSAAQVFAAGDDKALPTLTTLAQVRDTLALASKPPTLRTLALEPSTRITYPITAQHALTGLVKATRGLERYSAGWFEAVRDLDGIDLRWMKPSDQVEMDAKIPNASPVKV